MFASTQLDVVIGLDVHMELVPMPGPVPVPFPMPYVGMIECSPGAFLFQAGVAATLAWAFSKPPSGPVLVNGLPATKTGDDAKNVKTLPHFVIPPGKEWTPLPKPLKLKVRPPPPAPDSPHLRRAMRCSSRGRRRCSSKVRTRAVLDRSR